MVISLRKNFFTDLERTLVEEVGLKAGIFRYESGVEAVRISNEKGYIIILPYKGPMTTMSFMGICRMPTMILLN